MEDDYFPLEKWEGRPICVGARYLYSTFLPRLLDRFQPNLPWILLWQMCSAEREIVDFDLLFKIKEVKFSILLFGLLTQQ